MQFTTVAFTLFAALAAAQNSTSTSDESLSDLVSQLPTCAIDCFGDAASDAGCSTTDFECLCSKREFVTNIGACVLLGGKCSEDDISTASGLANQICSNVKDNPDPSQVAEASDLVTSALATASAASDNAEDAAARPDITFGMLGAGLLAALAL